MRDDLFWRGSWDGGRVQGPRRKRRPTAMHGSGRRTSEGGGRSPGHLVRMPAPYTVFSTPRANSAGSGVGRGRSEPVTCSRSIVIQDVWASNLEDAFHTIRHMVQRYNYIAMDTEFPGVVARPIGEFRSAADYQYQLLRCNVDLLKIIQLGLTFLDEAGNTAPNCCTWQFNFKFNLMEDMYAQDSIDLLTNSGIQFMKHNEEGIDPYEFAQLFMTSGVVFSENVRWLTFHSGYDFGYLLKLLTYKHLPADEIEFFELLQIFFPAIYDVKYLMRGCRTLRGGLQEVANQLRLERVGQQHQAGSDSLLTAAAFFKMRQVFFNNTIDDAKYCGHLYGLGPSFSSNGSLYIVEDDDCSAQPAPSFTKFVS
ncbi:CCR4-NOT transcription complex subunit 7-like isoform X2 [Dermacentor andersoni]|uniref:CCR4-NOT transcription complex subunit 7-like isoform X2 n=1 Tax=Dermacentor andersoni TaxID=34620 RepID=UPI0021556DE4